MKKNKVLIAAPVHEVLLKGLIDKGFEPIIKENITTEEALTILPECVGLITSTRLVIDKKIIDYSPHLKWIGRLGSGMEIIDVAYAAEKNIKCWSSPEGNCNAVAEHLLGMLLALNNKIILSNTEVKKGEWVREKNRGVELEGKIVGIIGYGHTGQAFAKKLQGFESPILAYDINPKQPLYKTVKMADSLAEIHEQADIISFHLPLNKSTYHYFNAAFLNCCKKPFVLLNSSRGSVINTAVLLEGLAHKKITGACLDVLENEPQNPLTKMDQERLAALAAHPQIIITPHIAGYSVEALFKMSKYLLEKID